MILHVVDASNPEMDEQMYIVYEILKELGVTEKPIITAFNKQDRLSGDEILRDFKADRTVGISAKTGEGLETLKAVIEELLREQKMAIEKLYTYEEAGQIQLIRKYGELLKEEYREDGIYVQAFVPMELYQKIEAGK